ncbi:MAG TPA: efflux RND transporter periplasmic adaptor subunit [Verrucomicrobiae bacterium]|nr:efflux RND transporter periplasmic adaptor subunit [Verrucomicrobiae bacterium]
MKSTLSVILSEAKNLSRWARRARPRPFAALGVTTLGVAFAIAVLTWGVSLVLVGCSKSEQRSNTPTVRHSDAKYHCARHPGVVSDKPDNCPICGMKLVLIDQSAAAGSVAPKTKIMYRSTMNPNEVSDHPGEDSMGMEMVPFEVEESPSVTVTGRAPITVSSAERQLMGLTFGTVEKKTLERVVRTSALIVPDEKRLYRVTTKISGWVDQLFVSVTGQEVKKGDRLLTIYSPDLVSAEQEFLSALATEKKLANSSDADTASGGRTLLAAARRRLQLWDISDAQIDRLAQTGEVEKYLTLYSPANGWVTEKNVLAGQKIMPSDSLLVVADLTKVWGDADIYESDLPYIKVGTPIEVTLPYWPDKVFKGEMSFLYPYLDPSTRTLKARLQIDNPELLLKPQMYANARLAYRLSGELAVPDTAALQTGEHTYAFRDGGNGRLIPVEIKTGIRSDGYYEVLSGLNEGDRVVTSADFLIDSESSMKAAMAAMAGQ